MADKIDREALCKKLIYRENIPFVLTGKGDLFPLEQVKERVREQAAKHVVYASTGKLISMSLWGVMIMGIFVCITSYGLLSVLPLNGRPLAGTYPVLACVVLISLVFIGVWLRAIYGIYRVNTHPEMVYLETLKQGKLIVGQIASLTRNEAGITDFAYEVDVPNLLNPTQLQRQVGTHHNDTFKVVETGDEVVILYANDALYIIL